MVEFVQDQKQWQIVLRPHRALTWRQNRLFLLLMSGIYAIISLGCLYFGLWPVFVFSGLDLALLFAAFWWVARQGQQRIVLRQDGADLVMEWGRFRPERQKRMPLAWTWLVGVPEVSGKGWASLRLAHGSQQHELSTFLNPREREELWQLLSRLGLRIRVQPA